MGLFLEIWVMLLGNLLVNQNVSKLEVKEMKIIGALILEHILVIKELTQCKTLKQITLVCLLIIYVPFLNIIFSTVPLHPKHLLPVLPFLYLILFLDELRKAWIRAFPFGYVKKFTYY